MYQIWLNLFTIFFIYLEFAVIDYQSVRVSEYQKRVLILHCIDLSMPYNQKIFTLIKKIDPAHRTPRWILKCKRLPTFTLTI